MKIAIGFDSGLANCGYGVVARGGSGFSCLAYGNIQTDAKTPHPDRLLKIYQHVTELITEWNPSKISIESVYWNRNQKSCLPTAEVIGILQLAAVQKDVEVVMLTPQSVKSAVTGVSNASKTQVMKMTQKLLGMKKPVTPSHAADALGCAIAALLRRNTPSLEYK
jgi:crossover junction endodeoxyribonuclease RuvC